MELEELEGGEEMDLDKNLFRNIVKSGEVLIAELNVEKAKVSEWNIRPKLTKEDLDEIKETLSKSIKELGLQQLPICDSKGEVYAGHRRLEAYRQLDKEWIPVMVKDVPEVEKFCISHAENKDRKDPDWLNEGELFSKACKKLGVSATELARKRGVSPQYVLDRIKSYEALNELPGGQSITFEQARMLSTPDIPDDKRQELVKMATEGMKTQDLRKIIANTNAAKALLDGETEEIKTQAEKEFKDKLYTKDLNIGELKWRLEEIAEDSHPTGRGRIWWDEKGIKTTAEAIAWFKKYGGRHLADKEGSEGEWDKTKEKREKEGKEEE